MSEFDGAAGKGEQQSGERIDHERREALTRLAKYTAPAMLAVLMANTAGATAPPISVTSDTRLKRDVTQVGELDSGIISPASAWDADPIRLRRLVFPRFANGAEPNARRLSSFETIERLPTNRVWLGNPVAEQRMSAFLAWLDRTPAYALSYGSLDDGMRLTADVVA
jgi:hypothetical protein